MLTLLQLHAEVAEKVGPDVPMIPRSTLSTLIAGNAAFAKLLGRDGNLYPEAAVDLLAAAIPHVKAGGFKWSQLPMIVESMVGKPAVAGGGLMRRQPKPDMLIQGYEHGTPALADKETMIEVAQAQSLYARPAGEIVFDAEEAARFLRTTPRKVHARFKPSIILGRGSANRRWLLSDLLPRDIFPKESEIHESLTVG